MSEETAVDLRSRLTAEMRETNIRALSRLIGVSHVTLYAFRDKGEASPETIGKVRAYFAAKDAPTPGAGDPSWTLALATMRAQSQMVHDLLQKTQEAHGPVLDFLRGLEATYLRAATTPRAEIDPAASSQAVAVAAAAAKKGPPRQKHPARKRARAYRRTNAQATRPGCLASFGPVPRDRDRPAHSHLRAPGQGAEGPSRHAGRWGISFYFGRRSGFF
jgi:hypothetical protein